MTDLKHWHWTCNETNYINKFRAIDENLKTGMPIHFVPRRGLLNVDFSITPTQSWKQLLKQRATNLREQYNYIKIWISGGVDSSRMLSAFLDNNVYIDEIVCVKSGIDPADYEINDIALPLLKSKHQLLRKTKITVISPSIQDYKNIRSNPYWMEDFNQLDTWHFRLNNWFECKEYENSVYNQSCANIVGKEKPMILYHNNEWWIAWMDLRLNPSHLSEHVKICFYEDDNNLVLSQAHNLKNYIVKTVPKEQYNNVCFYDSMLQSYLNFGAGRIDSIDQEFIVKMPKLKTKSIVHKNKKIQFVNNKDRLAIISCLRTESKLVEKWKTTIDEYAQEKQYNQWFNNNAPELTTVGVFSDFYSLERNARLTMNELFPNGFKLT